jgi:hypothetical protein
MSKRNTDSGQVIPVPETNMTPGATEGMPAPNMNADETNESAAAKGTRGNPPALTAQAYKQLADLGFEKQDVCELVDQIKVGRQKLSRARSYTAKQILGYEAWSAKPREQQIATGRSFPILCKAGAVPLEDTGTKNYSNARLYRVK